MSDPADNASTPLLRDFTGEQTATVSNHKFSRVAAFFKRLKGSDSSATTEIVRPKYPQYVRDCLRHYEELCTSVGLTLESDNRDVGLSVADFRVRFDKWKKTASATPTGRRLQEVGEEACALLDKSAKISFDAFQIHQRSTKDTETRWTLGQLMSRTQQACNAAIIYQAEKQMGWEDSADSGQKGGEDDSEL